MDEWGDKNKENIYSDHAPILYKIDNPDSIIPSGGGDEAMEAMEGGAVPIDAITWNIGIYGGQGKDATEKPFYYHKFNGEKESETERR